jgi:hypothetical protein
MNDHSLAGGHVMSSMKHRVLRLAALGIVAIAVQPATSALTAGNDTAIRLAMGPTSAPLKNQNQNQPQMSSTDITSSTAKPHGKHKHKAAQ